MFSRVLGLMRDMLVTAVFGTHALASAFYTAFTLPNLFRRLLGEGALTAAFVPTVTEELRQRNREGAFNLVNEVASWLLLVTTLIVGVSILLMLQAGAFGALALKWDVHPDTVRRWLAAAELAVILFPYLICVCVAAALSAALQTLGRFLEPALSSVWLNLAILSLLGGAVFGGWGATFSGKMRWLCAGALLGGVLQMIVPMLALMREGWRPRFQLTRSAGLRQIVGLMGPTVFGSAIYLINIAVSRFLGLSLNDAAVAILNLATRLMELPLGVFTIAVSTVVFPLIAKHAAAGDWHNMSTAYRKGMRLILVINVPAAVGLVVLAKPIIRLLFERGAFNEYDTQLMQPVLITFALGLPFLSFVTIVLRAYYAQKDTATPVRGALLSFIVNIGLSVALMKSFGTVGLAVAGNVATVAQAIFLQWKLAHLRSELAFRHVAGDLAKVIGSSLVMGGAVALAWRAWSQSMHLSAYTDMLGLAIVISGGIAVYGALVWVLKIEGRDDLRAVLARMRAKFG